MIRALIRWTGISLASLAAALLAMMLLVRDLESLYQSINPSSFDAEAWREGDIRPRVTMVDDLIDRDLLTGKTRDEVISLLGPPSYERPASLLYTVDIGTRLLSFPWTYQLHVYFDEETGRSSSVFYTD